MTQLTLLSSRAQALSQTSVTTHSCPHMFTRAFGPKNKQTKTNKQTNKSPTEDQERVLKFPHLLASKKMAEINAFLMACPSIQDLKCSCNKIPFISLIFLLKVVSINICEWQLNGFLLASHEG